MSVIYIYQRHRCPRQLKIINKRKCDLYYNKITSVQLETPNNTAMLIRKQ